MHTSFLCMMSRIRMGIPIYPYAGHFVLHLWKEKPFGSFVLKLRKAQLMKTKRVLTLVNTLLRFKKEIRYRSG
jgi:hypothetical protein